MGIPLLQGTCRLGVFEGVNLFLSVATQASVPIHYLTRLFNALIVWAFWKVSNTDGGKGGVGFFREDGVNTVNGS